MSLPQKHVCTKSAVLNELNMLKVKRSNDDMTLKGNGEALKSNRKTLTIDEALKGNEKTLNGNEEALKDNEDAY